MEVGQILKGHINEFLGLNKDITKERLKICLACPLYLEEWGGRCNPKLWMHPQTKDVSVTMKDGYKKGCGCRLIAKTSLLDAVCPCDQW